jgi:hypothetical protein
MNEWWGKQGCHHQNRVSGPHKKSVLICKSLPAGGGASRPSPSQSYQADLCEVRSFGRSSGGVTPLIGWSTQVIGLRTYSTQ